MSKFLVLISMFFVFTNPVLGAGDEDPFLRLSGAKSLKCTLGPGASADWESGSPKVEKGRFDITLHFDSINLKSKTARLIGNQGAASVTLHISPSGLTFFEETGSGNMVFTTVFSTQKKGTNDFIAVTSRHMDLLGSILPSQYHGTCKIWE